MTEDGHGDRHGDLLDRQEGGCRVTEVVEANAGLASGGQEARGLNTCAARVDPLLTGL
jgi:hypothetical protein